MKLSAEGSAPRAAVPIFGPWLFRDVRPPNSLHLVGPGLAFRAFATRTIRTVGGEGRTACGGVRRRTLPRRRAASPRHAGAAARLRATDGSYILVKYEVS